MIELQNKLADRASDLETAYRNLESFSYMVSNDLLRSLISIGDHANAIRDFSCDKNDEKCKEHAKRIYEKIKHLGNLIGSMHDFYRPTRNELLREDIDMSTLVSKTAAALQQADTKRQATVHITAGIMVNADRNQLQTALDHLLENAWKRTGNCEDAMIEFGQTEIDGKQAYFVRDNGAGFDMAQADGLFKPFRPLPGAEEFATDGIGLATVERIILRHGGKVWAEGEPGKGATFFFSL